MAPIYHGSGRYMELQDPATIWAIAFVAAVIAITFVLVAMICGCCEKEDAAAGEQASPKPKLDASTMTSTGTKTDYSTHMSMPSRYNASAPMTTTLSQELETARQPSQCTTLEIKSAPDFQLSSVRSPGSGNSLVAKTSDAGASSKREEMPSLRMTSVRSRSARSRSLAYAPHRKESSSKPTVHER